MKNPVALLVFSLALITYGGTCSSKSPSDSRFHVGKRILDFLFNGEQGE
jgi:hypothetical protein